MHVDSRSSAPCSEPPGHRAHLVAAPAVLQLASGLAGHSDPVRRDQGGFQARVRLRRKSHAGRERLNRGPRHYQVARGPDKRIGGRRSASGRARRQRKQVKKTGSCGHQGRVTAWPARVRTRALAASGAARRARRLGLRSLRGGRRSPAAQPRHDSGVGAPIQQAGPAMRLRHEVTACNY